MKMIGPTTTTAFSSSCSGSATGVAGMAGSTGGASLSGIGEYGRSISRCDLMTATDTVEKQDSTKNSSFGGGGRSDCNSSRGLKRQSVLSRQRSSMSFDMGAKKIDQVSPIRKYVLYLKANHS